MKKTIFVAFFMLFAFAFTTTVNAQTKKSASGSSMSTTQQKETVATAENFEATFDGMWASLSVGQSISVKASGANYTLQVVGKTVYDGGDTGTGTSEKVRCEGGGIKFARCVQSSVDKYGCQKVTKVGDDNYKSEDC